MSAANDPNELVLVRELAAPRNLVFEAWTSQRHLEQWYAPKGFTCTYELDFRPGGAFHLTMRGMGMEHGVRGTYREIDVPSKIVQECAFDDVPGMTMVLTATFEDLGDRRTRLTIRQKFPALANLTDAQRATFAPRMQGAPIGWGQTLDNLTKYVEK